MPESLWQAVQEEAERQKVKTPPGSGAGPLPSLMTGAGDSLPGREEVRGKHVWTKERTSQSPKDRTFVASSGRPKERPVERRPYDFYRDQVLWLKGTKLEIEKRYGRRITANAMVQLALDVLIKDYQHSKEGSKLVQERVMKEVQQERTFVRTSV